MATSKRLGASWSAPLKLLTVIYATSTAAFTPEAFDVREATIQGVHNALFTGLTSCRDVVSSYISRIEAFNPTINAIVSLNPDALTVADDLDYRIAAGNVTGSLFCVPILLKDNFDAVGMNTTGGCLALAGNRPLADGPTIKAFKESGAVILGKTNMHELALEGLSVSSLGGQTINSYDQTRTPGGSSGGTGAAIAANLALLGTGTDTVNSLRSPASANCLFSFRPTRGLISRAGVIPISFTQDNVGAMARTLPDLAVALTVMAGVGFDPADNTTAARPPELAGKDYTAALSGGALKGLRLGVLDGFFNHTDSPETTSVNDAMSSVFELLQSAGVAVINVTESIYDAPALSSNLDVQTFEYRELLDAYLSAPTSGGTHARSFNEIYNTTTKEFLVIPAQYSYIANASVESTGSPGYTERLRGIQNLMTALDATFARHALDAVIYPEQKNLVVKLGAPTQAGRNGILAALTGSPVVHVPVGFSEPTQDAPVGVPIGMEILGRPWSEEKLLNIAQHISVLKPVRRMPAFADGTVETKAYESVPVITPNRGNIPAAYPVGVLQA